MQISNQTIPCDMQQIIHQQQKEISPSSTPTIVFNSHEQAYFLRILRICRLRTHRLFPILSCDSMMAEPKCCLQFLVRWRNLLASIRCCVVALPLIWKLIGSASYHNHSLAQRPVFCPLNSTAQLQKRQHEQFQNASHFESEVRPWLLATSLEASDQLELLLLFSGGVGSA